MLGPIDHARALDLFAGTGALGIEALSRGAQSVVLVERDQEALRCLRANLAALRLDAPEATVRAQDSLSALRSMLQRGERYDLVFLDPPYSQASDLAERLAEMVPEALADGGLAVVESDRRAPISMPLRIDRQRRYGDTLITIHRADEP